MSHSLWLRFITVCALSFVQALVSTDLGVVREVTSRCRRLKRARGRGTMGTPVALQIFVAAAKAVVRVFIIAALGCYARHKNLLDADTARTMSRLNGAVFLPCLLFTEEVERLHLNDKKDYSFVSDKLNSTIKVETHNDT